MMVILKNLFQFSPFSIHRTKGTASTNWWKNRGWGLQKFRESASYNADNYLWTQGMLSDYQLKSSKWEASLFWCSFSGF